MAGCKSCRTCHEDASGTDPSHGRAKIGECEDMPQCMDFHGDHDILPSGVKISRTHPVNLPATCGRCHTGVANDFWEGIHGKLVARGETDAPVCTHCHGEHGIFSPDDPRSPVARTKVAEQICSPCHESAVLNEKYGLPSGRLTSFIDSYHGLESKAGDTHVAKHASCHGAHRILPSSDPTSTINQANLQATCGECHPGISEAMANKPIHGVRGQGLQTTAADVVERIYIVAIVVIIGLMVFIQYLPKGALDVALVIHYWKACLATLAIVVWHLYSTVFNPHVYPMNPAWLTGRMPEEMYRHEHPEHLEESRRELGQLRARNGDTDEQKSA